jgi:hypothetical protein
MWAIVGYVCGGLVLAVLILFVVIGIRQAAIDRRVREQGRDVLAWVVMANDQLYVPSDSTGHSYAQVVFALQDDSPRLREQLQEIAESLPSFQVEDKESKDERIIASVLRSHVPYPDPLRIPDRVTGGLEAYTVSLQVHWNLLPERHLSLPYVYCRVIVGEKGGAVHVANPPAIA